MIIRRRAALRILGAAAIALPLLALAGPWETVKRQIDRKFPDVPKISTEELGRLIAQASGPKPMLLDVRTRAEFDVSHIANARHVEPQTNPVTLNLRIGKDAPIVTYCAVGYRSAEFARKLHAAGFTNVRNLDGSIFQWANEGRPLVRNGKPATTVHPYDRLWGQFLSKERRAEIVR